jgi:hypothetical protein
MNLSTCILFVFGALLMCNVQYTLSSSTCLDNTMNKQCMKQSGCMWTGRKTGCLSEDNCSVFSKRICNKSPACTYISKDGCKLTSGLSCVNLNVKNTCKKSKVGKALECYWHKKTMTCKPKYTSAPTNAPTTKAPTNAPTNEPTNEPTTKAPTNAPTNEPTTKAPTNEPNTPPPV